MVTSLHKINNDISNKSLSINTIEKHLKPILEEGIAFHRNCILICSLRLKLQKLVEIEGPSCVTANPDSTKSHILKKPIYFESGVLRYILYLYICYSREI